MIIKARSITADHAKNTLGYVDKEEKDHLFLAADGIDISSIKSMMEDFNLYKSNKVKNGFITTVISPSKKDSLDIKGMEKLLSIVQKELKLDNRQFYAVIHQNTETLHIHLISNRIDFDGKVWNDHHVAWKCQEACKKVCLNYQYTSANNLKGTYKGNRPNEKSEFHKSRNESIKEIKELFKSIKYQAISIDQVYNHFQKSGINVEIKKFKNGLFGVSFENKGYKFKASEVDRLLTVLPNEDSYTASAKFQLIIDNNLARIEGLRGEKEILQDISKQPELASDYSFELIALSHLITSKNNKKHNSEREEEQEKYLSKKHGKRGYQIGFKIQI